MASPGLVRFGLASNGRGSAGGKRWTRLPRLGLSYLTESLYGVVLQKSIPTQFVLYISNNKG